MRPRKVTFTAEIVFQPKEITDSLTWENIKEAIKKVCGAFEHGELEIEVVNNYLENDYKPMKFKVGDKVRILWEKTCYTGRYEDQGVVISTKVPGHFVVKGFNKNNPEFNLSFKPEALVKKIGSFKEGGEIMAKLSALAKRVLPGKFNSLYKAGLLDSDMNLSERGERELEAILVEAHLEDLVKTAKAILAEKKK